MTPEIIFELLKSLAVLAPDVWQIYEDVKNKKPLKPELEALLKDLESVVANFMVNK